MAGLNIAQLPAQQQPSDFQTGSADEIAASTLKNLPPSGGQPAAPSGNSNSPYAIIQSKFNDVKYMLGNQFQADEQALQSQYLSDEQYEVKSAELNAHYSNLLSAQSTQFRSQISELNRIKAMVGRGEVDARAASQAGWQMVLPRETFEAKFPVMKEVKGTTPMSSAGVRSADALMEEFAQGFKEKRGFEIGAPKMTKESILEQYSNWRDQIGHKNIDSDHMDQLNQRWDSMMRSDKQFSSWFSDKEKKTPIIEVTAMRKRGKLSRAMAKKFVPVRTRQPVSTPVGRSFMTNLDKNSRKHLPAKQPAITASNEQTGEKLQSFDGGKTWQPMK
jgi:hypothetical protein